MQTDIDLESLGCAPSAASVHRSLEGINLADLRLSDLVRLKEVFSARILEDNNQAVDIPEAVLDTYNRLLTDKPLKLQRFDLPRNEVRRVSLLSPFYRGGPHLEAVSNFIGFLVSMQSLDRVDAVFSAELTPAIWTNSSRDNLKAMLTELLSSSVARFHGLKTAPEEYLKKLRIVVAPEVEELAEAIGDVVIRHEGTVPRNQFRLCTRSIFSQRPVLATVGTSLVTQVPDIDLLLTPARRSLGENEALYLRPLPRFPDDPEYLKFSPPADGSKVLLSGYASDKLARGLMKLDESDWNAMKGLFRRFPEVRWHLFGAKDVDAVWRVFPPAFLEMFSTRITVSGMIDLTDVFGSGFSFLALPGVGGSGTTARLALREAVPVLVCWNGDRDISNMFPHPAPHKSFPELVELLSDWAADSSKRAEYLAHQLADINSRANLSEKSVELSDLLTQATRLYRRRTSRWSRPGLFERLLRNVL